MEQEQEQNQMEIFLDILFHKTNSNLSYMYFIQYCNQESSQILIKDYIKQEIENTIPTLDCIQIAEYWHKYNKISDVIGNIVRSSQGLVGFNRVINKIFIDYLQRDLILQKYFNLIETIRQEQYQSKLASIVLFLKQCGLFNEGMIDSLINSSIKFYDEISQTQNISKIYANYLKEQELLTIIDDEDITKSLTAKYKEIISKAIPIASPDFSQREYSYQLYKLNEVIGSHQFNKQVYEYVHSQAIEIIQQNQDLKQPSKIPLLIDLKNQFEAFLNQIAPQDDRITISMNDAIEAAILTKVNILSEQFSFYLDHLLTRQESHKDEQTIKHQLEQALSLFRYFSAKDIFEHFYTQRMTKRLILELSISLEWENELLGRLKQICGDQYMRKAEEVMRDIQQQSQFVCNGINTTVVLISQNSWTLPNTKLPRYFLTQIQEYYEQQHQQELKQKSLFWQYECSNCQIDFKKKYTLHVSAIQAIILELYNNQNSFNIKDIINTTQLDKEQIIKNILPLAQDRILLKDKDEFTLNNEFENKRKIIKINQMQKKEVKQDIDDSTSKILNERKYMIDACIVKIMKKDKQHTITELMKLVQSTLGLPLSTVDIKKQIEVLTEKEYICRDQGDMNIFNYVA